MAFSVAKFGEAADCQQAIASALAEPWDLITLDITMPGGGINALQQIRAQCPEIPVLIISMHTQQHYVTQAFKSGASGFLGKTSAGDELIHAVSRIRNGGTYLDNTIAEDWMTQLGPHTGDALHARLSKREFDVMRRIASGNSTRSIANDLQLSINTINTYRTRVLEKMQMLTNAELTSYALTTQLVE